MPTAARCALRPQRGTRRWKDGRAACIVNGNMMKDEGCKQLIAASYVKDLKLVWRETSSQSLTDGELRRAVHSVSPKSDGNGAWR